MSASSHHWPCQQPYRDWRDPDWRDRDTRRGRERERERHARAHHELEAHRESLKSRAPARISLDDNSLNIWNQWKRNCNACDITAATLFDMHHVVDQVGFDDGADLGGWLDHFPNEQHGHFLCSFGKQWTADTFYENKPCKALIAELDGYIFTDEFGNEPSSYQTSGVVRVYWPRNIPAKYEGRAVRVSGDKGSVSQLLGVPTILFDDSEANALTHDHASPANASVVVKVGEKKSKHHMDFPGEYMYSQTWQHWLEIIKDFSLALGETEPRRERAQKKFFNCYYDVRSMA